ncbi:hypothetical protein AYI69_g5850 [Smittium culicis]|uniref:Uncharacterized protein n=1 Tax=Smittium culicis TaxID=133412 RepID=A0A1R1Y318_9FUNG|nr:hypothetical protein AYI69_g5850 [Smittium culicis]
MSSKYQWLINSCTEKDQFGGTWTLVSFNLFTFLFFLSITIVAGPLAYRICASAFNWERHYISLVGYLNLSYQNLILGYVLFTLGNYTHTFNYLTVIFYFLGLFGYSFLVELPFLKVSLPTWRTWSISAWAVHLAGLFLIILAAGYFIYLSSVDGYAAMYIISFIFATGFIWFPIIICKFNSYIINTYPQGSPISRLPKALVLKVSSFKNKSLNRISQKNSSTRQRSSVSSCNSADDESQDAYPLTRNSTSNKNRNSHSFGKNQDAILTTPSLNRLSAQIEKQSTSNNKNIQTPNTNNENIDVLQSSNINPSNKLKNRPSSPVYLLEMSSVGNFNAKDMHSELLKKEIITPGFFEQDQDQDQDSLVSSRLTATHPSVSMNLLSRDAPSQTPTEDTRPIYLGLSSANPGGRIKYRVHLHHWQIFYILAFFTRFPNTISRITSGLVLGIYTQGATAYGHDHLLISLSNPSVHHQST